MTTKELQHKAFISALAGVGTDDILSLYNRLEKQPYPILENTPANLLAVSANFGADTSEYSPNDPYFRYNPDAGYIKSFSELDIDIDILCTEEVDKIADLARRTYWMGSKIFTDSLIRDFGEFCGDDIRGQVVRILQNDGAMLLRLFGDWDDAKAYFMDILS